MASLSALLRLQLSAARVIAACALLLAQQRAPQNTYSSQHSLLARGSIPRQVESNTKVTALCTARISICAVCALATGPLRRLGECKAHSTLLCPRSSRRRTLCPTHPGKLLRPYSSKGSLCARPRAQGSPVPAATHSQPHRATHLFYRRWWRLPRPTVVIVFTLRPRTSRALLVFPHRLSRPADASATREQPHT